MKETDDASALQLRNSIDKIEAEWREWLNMHYPNFAETLKDPEQARQHKKELIAQLKEKIERINNSNDEAEKATVPALTEDLLRIQGRTLSLFSEIALRGSEFKASEFNISKRMISENSSIWGEYREQYPHFGI